jgi:hypothetical protein
VEPNFAALLDMFADRLAARLNERVERETYSSRDLPSRTSRRRFAEVCRSGRVEGARREGRDWVCSRAAWQAARAQRPRMQGCPPRSASVHARADALLARAGLRVIGGGS